MGFSCKISRENQSIDPPLVSQDCSDAMVQETIHFPSQDIRRTQHPMFGAVDLAFGNGFFAGQEKDMAVI